MITPRMKKVGKGKRGEILLQIEAKNRVKSIQETGKDPEKGKGLDPCRMKKQIGLCLAGKGDRKGLDPETEEEKVDREIEGAKGDLVLETDVGGYRENLQEDLGLDVDHAPGNIPDEHMADQGRDPEPD